MTTPLPISNKSMARAMIRQTLREAPEQQRMALSRASSRYAPTRQRRGPLLRAAVAYMDRCLEDRVLSRSVAGKGKSALASWVFWEVLGEPPRAVTSCAVSSVIQKSPAHPRAGRAPPRVCDRRHGWPRGRGVGIRAGPRRGPRRPRPAPGPECRTLLCLLISVGMKRQNRIGL